VIVKERPFAEPHDALGGDPAGELDIAYQRVETWLALPLMDIALDTQFVAGSRLREFQAERLRLNFSASCCTRLTTWSIPKSRRLRSARGAWPSTATRLHSMSRMQRGVCP